MRGAGTQTVEEDLAAFFPEARVARMDSDAMLARGAHERVLDRFGRGEVDVLVGTQMIAKGLDFPRVTLVGVVSADTALAQPDFRAAERTFQLLAQVAGRAGRGDHDGRVVIQTCLPDHPAIVRAAAQDFEDFAAGEMEERRLLGYPPFGRLLRVALRGPNAKAVLERALETQRRCVESVSERATVLGPAEPPVARVKGQWRQHLLVKTPDHKELSRLLAALRAAPRPRGRVEEVYDVDPLG
jgi:primosomal protein N' (replication factor Y)